MSIKWVKKKSEGGFIFYKSECEVFSMFKDQAHGVIYWMVHKGRSVLGFFPSGKEAAIFVDECVATDTWPERHVDRRANLEEIRAHVEECGRKSREGREAEAAKRKAEQDEREAEVAAREAELKAKQAEEELLKVLEPDPPPLPEVVAPKAKAKAKPKTKKKAATVVNDEQASLF